MCLTIAALTIFIFMFLVFLISLAVGPISGDWKIIGTVILFIVVNIGVIISLFANCYRWLELVPSSDKYQFYNCLYFSIITWTTVGYGDIQPLGWVRAVAASEALIGYMIMGLLVGVVVSMVQRNS